jgi:mono/diheme cytochrome c family protein
MTSRLSRGIVLLLAAALSAGCSTQKAPHDDEALAIADPARGGDKLYRRYCGACHGLEGKGDGIVSSLMTPKPDDLTIMTRRFGRFPREWLIRVIDGRETVRAHGESDMPVWGAQLNPELGADASDAEIRAWIAAIVDYLATIQVE